MQTAFVYTRSRADGTRFPITDAQLAALRQPKGQITVKAPSHPDADGDVTYIEPLTFSTLEVGEERIEGLERISKGDSLTLRRRN